MMKIIYLILSMNFMSIMINKKMLSQITTQIMLILMLFTLFNNFLNYYWIKIYSFLGMDNISYSLILLTIWIIILSILSFMNNKMFNLNFINLMIMLMMFLIMSFSSINMMIFFLFFEISLIPIMLIIMGWGYQINRIQASMYMMFYTLFGSLPLLIMIMMIYNKFNSLNFNILWFNSKFNKFNLFIYMALNLAYFIKMPMYLTHLWLPKAHVEAPISGSMILAGIMLKLGSYGLYRSMFMFPKLYMNFNIYFIILSLLGSLITSLICMNQSDLKIIIAYSSVVHMGLLMASMLTFFNFSLKGAMLMMIAHGLCSPAMFYLTNLNYSRLNSRNLFMNKGLINLMPSITLWWFLIFICNFSAPPSLNLFSEIMLLNSLIQWNKLTITIIMLISFFSTCYSIFIYAFSQYGKMNFNLLNFKPINIQEFLTIILHWLPLNIMFMNLYLFI